MKMTQEQFDAIPRGTKAKQGLHQHEYTIAVEWEYGDYHDTKIRESWVEEWRKGGNKEFRRATVLMCRCGDEIRRDI